MTYQTDVIDKMFTYNLWANTQLLETCSTLDETQLAVEFAGGFGRIQPTFAHAIRAEGYYLNRMTGSWMWDTDIVWESVTIRDMLPLAKLSGEKLIALASQTDPNTAYDVELRGEPYRFFNWTLLLQAFYHGIEHRTQIKVLLTQLGVEHRELDFWDYTATL